MKANSTMTEKKLSETDQRLALRRRLFDEGAAGDGKVSPEDVAQYLRLSARSRQTFCHYTSLKAANSIFGSGRLWLTRMDLLNDMKECQKNPGLKERTYVASFAATPKESVAMWWMYGLAGEEENPETRPQGTEPVRVPVRLALKGVALRRLVEELQKDKDGVVQAEPGDKQPESQKKQAEDKTPLKVERIDFFDVLYVSTPKIKTAKDGSRNYGQIFWNERHTSRKRFKNGLDKGAAVLDGCLKDAGWLYEGETRISIMLDEAEAAKWKGLEHVSIPFAAALEDAELCVGPGRYDEEWLKECHKNFKHVEKLKSKQVLNSEYKIRFRKEA
jgi:hypothetical protein